jgi:4'-phosphopantetheinyl transferase
VFLDVNFMTLQTEFDNLVQLQKEGIYLFTTHLTGDLFDYLKDDYNFETSLRLVNDLSQQLKIQSIKNFELKCKKLILNLFTKLVLNYVESVLMKRDYDPWKNLNFTYNEYGKPQLVINGKPLQFNSSSSNCILSLVISRQEFPVGIDLSHSKQKISSINFLQEFKPIFNDYEYRYLSSIASASEKYLYFNLIWTLKEAFTKLLGCGLNIELSQFFFKIIDNIELIEPKYDQKMMSQFDVIWQKNIEINIDQLVEKKNIWLNQLQNFNFHCQSGILKAPNNDLPVIISIISQISPMIESFNINFVRILQLQ